MGCCPTISAHKLLWLMIGENMEVSEVFWDFPTIELLGYPHDLGNLHTGIEWDLV